MPVNGLDLKSASRIEDLLAKWQDRGFVAKQQDRVGIAMEASQLFLIGDVGMNG